MYTKHQYICIRPIYEIAIAEFNGGVSICNRKLGKRQFLRICCTNLAKNSLERLARRRAIDRRPEIALQCIAIEIFSSFKYCEVQLIVAQG